MWEGLGSDYALTEILNNLPPFARSIFLYDWQRGVATPVLQRQYQVRHPHPCAELTLEEYLVQLTEWEGEPGSRPAEVRIIEGVFEAPPLKPKNAPGEKRARRRCK